MTSYDLGTNNHAATAALNVALLPTTPWGASLEHVTDSTYSTVFAWPSTVNPITQREEYRVLLSDSGGNIYAELDKAVLTNVTWALNELGGCEFTLPLDDPKIADLEVPEREVQVWRGSQFLNTFVLTRARVTDDGKVAFQAVTLEWYLGRRVVGPVPRKGLLNNSHFETGIWGWDYTYLPNSPVKTPPAHSTSDDIKLMGDGSLMMSPSAGRTNDIRNCDDLFTTATSTTLSAAGKTAIQNITNATFGSSPLLTVIVYHDNTLSAKAAQKLTDQRADAIEAQVHTVKPEARVRAYGRGERSPRATNQTAAGRAQNRRAVFSYRNDDGTKGSAQYASQKYTIRVPSSQKVPLKATFRGWCYVEAFDGPAVHNWGLVLERQHPTTLSKNPKYSARGFHKVLARVAVPITKKTPVGKWIRMDASLKVPADGRTYVLEARMFCPSGLVYWDECDLFTDDGLRFEDEEESVIIQTLVEHAQDPDMGKPSLNIGTNCRLTGVRRTRTYLYSEREVILDLLDEFPTLMGGNEWSIETTPDTRTFTTYYPRKGADKDYPLVLGSNITGFSVDVDAEQTADQVIIQAYEYQGATREEVVVSDPTLLDGLVLEKAYQSTPGAAMATLYAQAYRGIERYRKPVVIPDIVSHPKHLSSILANVQVGDRVPVDVRQGWFQGYGQYRITQMSLDPSTDQITFTVEPEDQKVGVLLDWNATGWKYLAQDQVAKTGDGNSLPKETDVAYAARDYDDSAWATGQAPFGWHHDGTKVSGAGETVVNTTIPQKNEVWLRRTILCTEEMYIAVKQDHFTYIYVNGHRMEYQSGEPYVHNTDFFNKNPRGSWRVPSEWLDPSGVQVVAMHTQDRLADYSGENPDVLVADMKIRGIYNTDHIKGV